MAKTVVIDYLGRSASAVKAANEVAVANEKAAARSSTAFDKSTSRIGSSFNKLGNTLGTFGVPFSGALNVVGASLDKTSVKAKTFGSTMSKIGGVELIAAGAGLAFLGKSSVDAAQQFESAQARLQTSVTNTGSSFAQATPGISKTEDALRKLGFTDTETESSLARLTGATHDLGKAQSLMGLAADLARAKHTDLATATQLLVQIEGGRLRGLAQLGISTKDATGKTIDATEAFRRLNTVVGGQGQAFMGTFEGKLAAVHAEADKLQVTIGEALIPKIESLASGTVGAVQGFEKVNSATGGLAGKVALVAAGFPAAIFAIEKLNAAGVAIAGQFGKLGGLFSTTTAATEAQTAANVELAASEGDVSAGAAAEGAAVGGLGLGIAAAAGAWLLYKRNKGNALDNPLKVPDFVPTLGIFNHQSGQSSDDKNQIAQGQQFVETQKATAAAAQLAGASLDDTQRSMTAYAQAVLKGVSGADRFSGALGINEDALAGFSVGIDKGIAGLDAGQRAQLRYNLALAQYQADVAPGAHVSTKQLAADAGELKTAQAGVVGIQSRVKAVIGGSTGSTNAAAFAYLHLRDSVKTAADALTAITTRAFRPITVGIAVDTATSAAQNAIDELNNPTSGGGGSSGGGSGQTATSAALDQRQKVLSLRDAKIAEADATRGVTDAEKALTQARKDSKAAAQDVLAAEKNLHTVLHGVAADSRAAADATDAFKSAQVSAKSAVLDLADAHQSLKDAIEAQKNAGQNAQNDLSSAQVGVSGAQLGVDQAQQALARARQTQDSGEIASAQQALAESQQRLVDATTARADAEKHLQQVRTHTSKEDEDVKRAQLGLTDAQIKNHQATEGQTDAQRIYNGVLHGYPPASQEATDAQKQLTDAQTASKTAIDQVVTAQRGLQTAQDQTATSALALDRAQADLDGKLNASTGASSAGGKLKTLKQRTDDAKAAIIDLANQAGAADLAVRHSFGHSILTEIGVLETYANANPILAKVFGTALTQLDNEFAAAIIQQAASTPTVFSTPTVRSGSGQHPRRAGGGAVEANREYLVGEKGPELFVPRSAGDIVPNSSLAASRPFRVGGGGNVTNYFTITIHATDGDDVVRKIQQWERKNGRPVSSRPR